MNVRLIAAVVITATFGGAAQAQAQRVEGARGNPRREALERKLSTRTAEVIKRRLELTDAQMTRLQATNRQFEEQRRALFTRERETRVALRREMMAGPMETGGFIISKSSPSMRKRTLSFFSEGSMWMSLAPSLVAVWMM